jgi:lysophospholipase L1-like esterase
MPSLILDRRRFGAASEVQHDLSAGGSWREEKEMKSPTLFAATTLAIGLMLLAHTAVRTDAPRVPIYPTLAANPDLVQVGPYGTIRSGAANWGTGMNGAAHSREFITIGNRYQIRQNGIVQRIRVNLQDTTGLTGFHFRIWRKIDRTYDMVGSSENLAPAMIAGPNTLDLKRPIAALEGDYYGYRVESTAAANFFARTGQHGVDSYGVADGNAGPSDYAWEGQTKVAGSVLPIEIYMQAPILVGIGTSIMEGYPAHLTFLEDAPTPTMGTDMVSYLGEQWRVTRQNMGIAGQLTREVAGRFTTDVLNLKPRLALLQAGTNDIVGGPSMVAFLASWKEMLDACQANGIKPLVLLINARDVYTMAQSQKRDSWNEALRALAAGYPGAVVVDPNPVVGEYRPGGPSNNLWNIAKAYSAGDGMHFNPAGYRRIAQAIVDQYTEP